MTVGVVGWIDGGRPPPAERAFPDCQFVLNSAVSAGEPEKIVRAMDAANDAAALLRVATRIKRDDLFTDQGFIGEGYGIPTPGGLEAIDLLARTEASLLDPVYTCKGFAALLAHVRAGDIPPTDTVVFLHTGGMPALFTREFIATRR